MQSVTKRTQSLKLVGTIVIWLAFLGFFVPMGKAVEIENSSFSPSNNNSPEAILRGIKFGTDGIYSIEEEYGYGIDDSVPFQWKDPAGATPVALSSPDDGFAGPISLGFAFPFYENTYSEVYVSANGYVSFDNLKGLAGNDAENESIPNEIIPNNFIAPFWSDLAVGGSFNSGTVSTKQGSDGNGQFLVINYVEVSKRLATTDLLTFQIILYESGNIWFQYNSLSGDLDSTVGIEDGDGLSGLQYSSVLLQDGLAVRFQRPGDTARVKLLSTLQSALTESGIHEFFLSIRNSGELGTDTYNLTTFDEGVDDSIWSVTLLNSGGGVLSDTNGDTVVDTGPVSQGETISITVRLQAPSPFVVGDHTSIILTATSSMDSNKTDDVKFKTANPSKHFIAFGNSAGLDLGRTTPNRQIIFDVTDFGDNPSLILTGSQYFYVWEDADFNPGTDIEYAVLSYEGDPILSPTKLTTNASAEYNIRDYSPTLAISANKRIGIVWVRRLIDPTNFPLGENYNVFWAVLDRSGNVLVPPTAVTNNDPTMPPCDINPQLCWQDGDNIDVPVFSSPEILATKDNRFIISWVDSRILPGGDVTNIGYTVYDTEGSLLRSPDDLKNGNAGGDLFEGPRLLELSNERILLAYSTFHPGTEQFTPVAGLYDIESVESGSEIIEDQGNISMLNAQGTNLDSALLTASKILLAWTDTSGTGENQIQYSILTDNGVSISDNNPYFDLQTPDSRESNFVSIAATSNGEGILSWIDAKAGNRVYYALVGSNGNIITPAMIAWEDNETITISQTGQGIVAIPDWYLRLPFVFK